MSEKVTQHIRFISNDSYMFRSDRDLRKAGALFKENKRGATHSTMRRHRKSDNGQSLTALPKLSEHTFVLP